FFHFAQYLAIPVFPLFQVNFMGFSDQVISLGSSLFSVTTFLGSMRLAGWVRRQGNKRVLGTGVIMLSLYPLGMSLVRNVSGYLVVALIGGLAWALVGGAIYNYLFERAPADDRPAYLAWYTLGLNAPILRDECVGGQKSQNRC
ncbi:MAG TPA: MFS transporter, partial [Anaerolineaceae bacterium]|nr:MFS transporter [Anaerolineaceae bacterium]